MEIYGRDQELARVDAVFQACAAGPSGLLIEGEAGIGKTTVWRAGVRAAQARGYQVLSSRPAEADASLAYAGLGDLVGGVELEAYDALPAPQRHALDVALLRCATDGVAPEPRAVFAGFVTLLGGLAAQRPTVVAVDDVQWLDAPSLRALAFAARRVDRFPLVFLASQRVNGHAAAAEWLDPADRVRLAPLSPAALHQLIKERLGWSPSRPTLLRVHALCAGNAFYALEIARVLVESGRAEAHDSWPIPKDVRQLVESRVRALPRAARSALRAAAAASQPTTDLLDPAALEAAQGTGLVSVGDDGRLRFAHPLYATAIYVGMSPAERAAVHADLAEREPNAEKRARHRSLSVDAPDEGIAVDLDTAAARARARGAPEIAAELQQFALEKTPPMHRVNAARRAFAAAVDLFRAGSLQQAATLVSELTHADDPAARGQALRLLAQVRFREENYVEAFRLLTAAAAEADGDAVTEALVRLDLTLAHLSFSLDHSAAAPQADAALALAERIGDRALLARALGAKTLTDFLLSRGLDEDRLARSLALEDPESDGPLELQPTLIAGFLAGYTGRLDDARAFLLPLRQRLLERGQDTDLPLLVLTLAWFEIAAGNFAAARQLADEGLATAMLGKTLVAHALACSALLEAHTGNAARCRAHAAEALAAIGNAEHCLVLIWSTSALGHLELALDDPAAARDALEPLTSFYERERVHEPTLVTFLPDAIEALISLGELERAGRLTELLERSAERFARPSASAAGARCRALLLAAANDIEGALAATDRALAANEQTPMPLDLARTLIVRGRILRRARRKAPARDALQQAAETCEQLGAPLWAARARRELARLTSRREPNELTATEERVAALAASGLTNREIAAAAFISQKTVEANLSRIYRKLTIRSRAELGLRLAQLAPNAENTQSHQTR